MSNRWVINKHLVDVASQENDLLKLTFTRTPRHKSCDPPSDTPFNRYKLRSRSVSTKRKKISSPTEKSTSKKANLNMDKDAIAALIDQTTENAFGKMRADMSGLEERIIRKMEAITAPIESAMNNLTHRTDENERDIVEISKKLETIRTEITEEIKSEIREELHSTKNEQVNLFLRNEIEKTSTNLIIYGYRGEAKREDILQLFDTMKVENLSDLKIVKISKLGMPKGKGDKVPPILISLSDSDQRNSVLKAGINLPVGVTMERDMPYQYRACYKRFKKHAWKLRAYYDVKTQIVFDAHVLILRYREDGKAFTILEEFVPSTVVPGTKPNKNPPTGNGPPSSVVNNKGFTDDTTSCVILVLNQAVSDSKHLYELISPHLTERMMRDIRDTKVNKGNSIIKADSPDTAERIAKQLNGKLVCGKKIFAEPFGHEI